MNALYEDIDEDLDELDDESWIEDDDESLAERRRRRRNRGPQAKGGGYNQPRLDNKSPVSQTQLQAALARVGEDVKKLAAQVRSLETRADSTITRINKQNQGLGQMAMMMPMLMKKSITTTSAIGNIPAQTRVLVDDNDSMSMLLPFMMMNSNSSGNGNGNGQNDMMMMMMMMVMLDRQRPAGAS